MQLSPKQIRTWIKDLESGEFKQTSRTYYGGGNRYCAVGLLWYSPNQERGNLAYWAKSTPVHPNFVEALNQLGFSFKTIAKYLRWRYRRELCNLHSRRTNHVLGRRQTT